ncbi:TPA: hypothetical protein ACX6SN_000914 [Photobacterium damselae]|uniref:hypothetical protein n=1 Tax=Photobacterium damselae TaxID=38293 RepID=UPI000D6691F8|nr:hypothetical protein [Photobacterium damselae]AWK81568.1 hypothetical protein BST98_05605 [Photobacterium damselae]UKA02797.1 hypothetical protein IHC89_05615 [Photobacterium damselae subsp. damselae]
MSNWNSKRLHRWTQTRKKGSHYVLKTILITRSSILVGKTIGFMLFDKVWTRAEFWIDFSLSVVVL